MNIKIKKLVVAVHLIWLPSLLWAQEPVFISEGCRVDPLAAHIRPDTGTDPNNSPIDVLSDHAESDPESALMQGDVSLTRGDEALFAERVMFDKVAQTFKAEGEVRYATPLLVARAQDVGGDLANNTVRFETVDYYLQTRGAQGTGKNVRVDNNTKQIEMDQSSYSTCERGKEVWQLRTDQLTLFNDEGIGVARNIRLAMFDTPVIWLPYLRFPIDDKRHTGFLVPALGSDSRGGFWFKAPYYWNIAPEMDATFTPGYYAKRGLFLGAEFRFLSENHSGEIAGEFLPDDDEYGKSRSSILVRHRSNFYPGFHTNLLFQKVSDRSYVEDISNSIGLLSDSNLERRFDISYQADNWSLRGRVQDFQVLSRDIFPDDPYSRLPQIVFDSKFDAPLGLQTQFYSEYTRFDAPTRYADGRLRPRGQRFDIYASASLPLETSYGFIRPKVGWRYTGYDLENMGVGKSSTPHRSMPIYSLDAGLFFEREIGSGSDGMIQTFEPRLFYLRVPYRNQSVIPVFDSASISPNYSWLFLENQFTGADRQSDANQLTTAFTMRWLENRDGFERARLSVGQIQYFDDPRVLLDYDSKPSQITNGNVSNSDIIVEGQYAFSKDFSVRGTIQHNIEGHEFNRGTLDLRYQPDSKNIFNVAYRYEREHTDISGYQYSKLNQIDFATIWKLDENWGLMGRWNYSMQANRTVDIFGGLEYDSCCWAVRALARNHRTNPDDESSKTSFYFQLELKGLGGTGQNLENLLSNAIVGYEPRR